MRGFVEQKMPAALLVLSLLVLPLLTVPLAQAQSAPSAALAADAPPQFADAGQEGRYRALIDEFRCPKCQNNNLAGSDAPIAQDLRRKTAQMIQAGQTDAQIRAYMTDRYGDFISYRPPVRPSTWLLWGGPPLLLVVVLLGWVWRLRRRVQASTTPEPALSEAEARRLRELLDDRASTDHPAPTEEKRP